MKRKQDGMQCSTWAPTQDRLRSSKLKHKVGREDVDKKTKNTKRYPSRSLRLDYAEMLISRV